MFSPAQLTFRCALVATGLHLLSACSLTPPIKNDESTYSLKAAPKCVSREINTQHVVPIFDGSRDLLKDSGWSHVHNPAKPVFNGLSRSPHDPLYNIPTLTPVADSSCPKQQIYRGILVKKYGDYDNQHANGLEPKVSGVKFGEIAKLVLELRIDSQTTKIPSKTAFKQRFQRWLSDAQLDQIDNQQVNLRVTLFSDKVPAPAEGYALATELFVTIEPATQADRWLRLEIPLTSMKAYKGLSYKQTTQDLASHADTPLAGIQINPETRGNDPATYGKVARNFMRDNWGKPQVPKELFKEYGFSLRRLSLQLKH